MDPISGREVVGEGTKGERAIQSETSVKLQMYEWLRESFVIPGNSFMLHFDLSAKLFCFKRCRKMQGQFNCCQNHSFRARNLKVCLKREQYYGHEGVDVKGWARARWENEQFKVKQL